MSTGGHAQLLSLIVREAEKAEAADILLSFGSPPLLKVRGKLVALDTLGVLSDSDLGSIVNHIAPKSKLEELKNNLQLDISYTLGDARFRVNMFHQRGHVSLVLRYIKSGIPNLDELGLPPIAKDLLEHDNGLILMVGPTGSGKSTTLAAMVEHVNQNYERHIITIEDPVEYLYENKKSLVQQRELGVDALSFSAALRSALREAPDVILLGEMRDLDSISAAVTVAETGHLVLSTVHANSAPGAIDRIIDIFPEASKDQIRIQLADILLGVISQRLVPRADGNGVVLVAEIMIGTSAVRNAIRSSNSAQLPTIIQTASGEGMCLLDDQLIRAAERGDITKESALAFASDRESVKRGL